RDTMARGRRNHHDRLAGHERPMAMDDKDIRKAPARPRLLRDGGDGLLGHPGIVLDLHPRELSAVVTDDAKKGDDGAHVTPAMAETGAFRAIVERFGLDAHLHRSAPRHRREERDL